MNSPTDADGTIEVIMQPDWISDGISDTEYVCQIFNLSSYTQSGDRHIIGYESTFDATPGAAFVHHTVIYGCRSDSLSNILAAGAVVDRPFLCPDVILSTSSECPIVVAGLANSKLAVSLPENVGYRIGNSIGYLLVNIHINNPTHVPNIRINKI